MKRIKNIFFATVVCSTISCAHSVQPTESPRDPAGTKAQLPDHVNWDQLETFTQNLNLSSSNVTLSPSTGGTSVYGVVNIDGKAIGALIPENSATVLSGEIMAFSLARAFGVWSIYQPAFYHSLSGRNYQIFRSLIANMDVPSRLKLKAQNKADILARMERNPNGIATVFKQFAIKPLDYDALVSASTNSFNKSHVLKGSRYPISSLITCSGPQPVKSTTVSVNGGKNSELYMSMQLSTIFLIDALTQQWDRFSGGNLQSIVTKEGVAKFVAFDSGGTWGGTSWTNKFLKLVTRFDPEVATKILAMDDFFKKGIPFQGIRTETEFAQAMGIEKFPQALKSLKSSLPIVAAHLRANAKCIFAIGK